MAAAEDMKHDLLLIIATALFVGFSIGFGAKNPAPATIIVPPVR